ncbi:MAG: diaminopimelate decarboxylase [Clostridia bacterium]|nr:diaminopimelate decarboxylase [Clostridia bacterium]
MKKTLPYTEAQIREIIKEYPTPFHIYDEKALRSRIRALQKAFSWNEGYREYYAVKACPTPVLMQIMKEEGCGMDCSSYAELMLSESVGITGDGIMFSSNATPAEDFEYARRLNATINLDDISHIDFLAKHGGIPEVISCRFNPGGEFKIGTQIMGNPAEAKYGFTREQLTEGMRKLKEMGVKEFGIHSFLSSNNIDNMYYPTLAALLFEVVKELSEELDIKIGFVNLSGGVGIPYRPEDAETDIQFVGDKVKEAYEKAFAGTNIKPRIFTELGRYVTGPVGTLVTTVLHEKKTHKDFIGCDACAANLMRPAMYGAYHHVTVLGKEDAPCDHLYDITGSLCESNDRFAIDRMLPEIEIGDIIAIHDTGAHGFSMGYNYNGKLRSAELLLREDGSVKLIRRAETTKDYFATFDFLGLPRLDEVK